jgi:hypothetical protein
MEKEVIPASTTPQPTTPQKNKIDYKYIGPKESLWKIVGRSIPKELAPTKKLSYAFGIIFILVILIGIAQFPLGSLFAGIVDIKLEVGIPMKFLVFNLGTPETIPINIIALIIDMAIYLILAYAVDVALNVFLKSMKSKKVSKGSPKVYTIKKHEEKIAEKVAKKIVKKPDSTQP